MRGAYRCPVLKSRLLTALVFSYKKLDNVSQRNPLSCMIQLSLLTCLHMIIPLHILPCIPITMATREVGGAVGVAEATILLLEVVGEEVGVVIIPLLHKAILGLRPLPTWLHPMIRHALPYYLQHLKLHLLHNSLKPHLL
jgi:hypothetical protein